MKIQQLTTPTLPAPNPTPAPPQTTTVQDVVSVSTPTPDKGESVLRHSLRLANETGDNVGRVSGGTGGLVGALAGAYVGGFGGAAAMGLLGLGAGIPAAILGGNSGLHILSSALHTSSLLAQGGVLVATATGIAGGYYLGSKVGYAVGYAPTAALTVPVGVVTGAAHKLAGTPMPTPTPQPAQADRHMSKRELQTAGILTSIGAVSGLAGGAAIGGLVASGVNLTAGLIAKDVAWQAVAHTGLLGAGIGALAGAALLGVGGYQLVKGSGDVAHAFTRYLARGKEKIELDMRNRQLDAKLSGLAQSSETFHNLKTAKAQQLAATHQENLDVRTQADKRLQATQQNNQARLDQMTATEATTAKDISHIQEVTADKTNRQDELSQQRGDMLLQNLKDTDQAAYDKRKGELASWSTNMDHRDAEWTRKEKEFDTIVDKQSDNRRDTTQSQLESKYQARKGGLDNREAGLKGDQNRLDARKADLPNLIHKEGDKHIAKRTGELEADLSRVRSGLQRDLDTHSSQLQSERSNHQSELQSQESRIQQGYSSDESSLQSQVNSQQSHVSSLRSDNASKSSQLSSSQSHTSSLRSQTQNVLSSITSEKSNLERQAQEYRNQASQLRNQLSSLRSQLSSAQSGASSARAEYQRISEEYNQLQAEIQSLNNQIASKV